MQSLPTSVDLTIVVNTADDDVFHGLHVSPDIDTVLYTLAGIVAPDRGWGIRGDSFACLESLGRLGEPTWFRLGDRDLATHLVRTDMLNRGASLSEATDHLRRSLGVAARVLPMSDDPVRTFVGVAGVPSVPFQQYLVRDRAVGDVVKIEQRGTMHARPAPGVLDALAHCDAILVPPSNPFVSIGPIVGLPGVRASLRRARSRVVAISPIIDGRPVKGPLDRMLRGLGHEVSALGVARLYRSFVGTFVLDRRDAESVDEVRALGMNPVVADTLMATPARARRLAAVALGAVCPSAVGESGH